jgi:hypothetical protein
MNAYDPVISQPITCKLSCKNRVAKIEILIFILENVEIFHGCLKLPFFWPKKKTPFYRFVLDPVSDPVSDSDSNPDPKCLFRIRIGSGSGQKLRFRIRIRNTVHNAGFDFV